MLRAELRGWLAKIYYEPIKGIDISQLIVTALIYPRLTGPAVRDLENSSTIEVLPWPRLIYCNFLADYLIKSVQSKTVCIIFLCLD